MIFEIISGGEKTDWVGKEWAGLFFPRGKNGPAHSFPGEKTDWGEIPACYTGMFCPTFGVTGVSTQLQSSGLVAHENSTFRNLALAVSGSFMA